MCDFFFAKTTVLINKYTKMGVFDWPEMRERKAYLLQLIDNFKQTEEYQKWTTFTQHLI